MSQKIIDDHALQHIRDTMENYSNSKHPVDQYIFWGEKDREKIKKMQQVWDKLVEAGVIEDVKFLIEEATSTAILEDAYNNEDFSGNS